MSKKKDRKQQALEKTHVPKTSFCGSVSNTQSAQSLSEIDAMVHRYVSVKLHAQEKM